MNGFGVWASLATGGVDKGHKWLFCRFNGLGTPHSFTGTSNTDSCTLYSCWLESCGTTLFDNDNALLITYQQCNIWSAVDQFRILDNNGGNNGRGGGGAVALRDCDLIINNINDDTTAHYTLRIDSAVDFFRTWLFDNCRWELRGTEARVLYWTGTASYTNSHVEFRTCDLSVMQENQASYGGGGADTDGRRNIIVQGPNTRSVWARCYFANQLGIEFTNVNTARA